VILPWNRREVYVGTSIEKFDEILGVLAGNKIKYEYTVNGGRGFITTAQMRHIFIHKKDLTKFQELRLV